MKNMSTYLDVVSARERLGTARAAAEEAWLDVQQLCAEPLSPEQLARLQEEVAHIDKVISRMWDEAGEVTEIERDELLDRESELEAQQSEYRRQIENGSMAARLVAKAKRRDVEVQEAEQRYTEAVVRHEAEKAREDSAGPISSVADLLRED